MAERTGTYGIWIILSRNSSFINNLNGQQETATSVAMPPRVWYKEGSILDYEVCNAIIIQAT